VGLLRRWTRSAIGDRRRPRLGASAGSAEADSRDQLPSLERSSEAAVGVVRRAVLRAEEKYLVDPDATLGTWFARVSEPIAVASRVTLARIAEGRLPVEEDIAKEQIGLFADICAEAIRAAAQVWGTAPSAQVREETLQIVARRAPMDGACSRTALKCLVCCIAALEPLANGLREGDLPMSEPADCEVIAESLLGVAGQAFAAVGALC
jgi:hypothetical protein